MSEAQPPLPLAYVPALEAGDFHVSAANADAVAWIDRWRDWPQPQALLVGPPGSGKSHLARIFAGRSGATVIEDAERHDQAALFHAWNAATPAAPLLLTARAVPRQWVTLPDLASRLAATPTLTIADPDDALLTALLAKQFADRGLRLESDVAAYIVARIDRSFEHVAATVAALDARALETRRDITVPLAREVMEAQLALPWSG